MSMEKGSVGEVSAVRRGATEMGLKHPDRKTARKPAVKAAKRFADFMHNSLLVYPRGVTENEKDPYPKAGSE
jgi:hypothetical protein